MKNTILLLLVCINVFLYSCDKNNEIVKQDNTSDSTDTTEIVKIKENIFFPIDTLQSYIYKNTTNTFDDTGIEGWTTNINYDTIYFENIQIYNNTEYRTFDGLNFTTTENTISIFTNLNDTTDELEILNVAYTNKNDTIWNTYVSKGGFVGNFQIEQTFNNSTDEFTIKIPAADVISGLYQEYRFKKNKGLVYKSSEGGNIQTYYELIN